MFAKKNNYFLLIENIKDIDLKNIKIRNKFSIVYRNNKKIDNLNELHKFRRQCMLKAIKFFIANDYLLAITLILMEFTYHLLIKVLKACAIKNHIFK